MAKFKKINDVGQLYKAIMEGRVIFADTVNKGKVIDKSKSKMVKSSQVLLKSTFRQIASYIDKGLYTKEFPEDFQKSRFDYTILTSEVKESDVDTFIEWISEYYGYSPEYTKRSDLVTHDIVGVRRIIWLFLKYTYGMRVTDIGKLFNSAVYRISHGIKQVKNRLDVDLDYRDQVSRIVSHVNEMYSLNNYEEEKKSS